MGRKVSNVFAKELNWGAFGRGLIALRQRQIGQNWCAVKSIGGSHGGREEGVNWCEQRREQDASSQTHTTQTPVIAISLIDA